LTFCTKNDKIWDGKLEILLQKGDCMIYAISDIHGCYKALENALDSNDIIKKISEGSKLIFLGDYIDRGPDSYRVLERIWCLQKEFGSEKVVVLKGNHEDWFLSFLFEEDDIWLVEDGGLRTSKTFLQEEDLNHIVNLAKEDSVSLVYSYIRERILKSHLEMLNWLRSLPLFYETSNQIFVHAGIDEEAGDLWKIGTADYCFLNKYPPELGHFKKMIIAGHVSTSSIYGDKSFHHIFYDKKSHIYIDGTAIKTGKILVLGYDEETNCYYEIDDGKLKRIN